MRTLRIAATGLACAVALLAPPRVAAGDDPEAAVLFRARCGSCHTIPDPALRTDRAWLDQVHRTA